MSPTKNTSLEPLSGEKVFTKALARILRGVTRDRGSVKAVKFKYGHVYLEIANDNDYERPSSGGFTYRSAWLVKMNAGKKFILAVSSDVRGWPANAYRGDIIALPLETPLSGEKLEEFIEGATYLRDSLLVMLIDGTIVAPQRSELSKKLYKRLPLSGRAYICNNARFREGVIHLNGTPILTSAPTFSPEFPEAIAREVLAILS